MLKPITLRLTGVGALLTHNEQLANPMHPIARDMKAISSKRTKTEDDFEALAELEFRGGLYLTDDGQIGFPSWNVHRSVQDGAKLNKLGRHVERAVTVVDSDIVSIKHDGPSDPRAAWLAGCFDQRSVKVGQSKVMRTRPRFLGWTLEVAVMLDTEILSLADYATCATNAGQVVGIGDYRPRFGRFDVEVLP